ncbi:pirin family protein [Roseomonas xinghualingensis]|uniref:pirin family protein n=1 Tax=Roseomonas xinghualingensis TaxID=2986475 RepID=UPI0021F20DAF|nr:pirin-like C-terminal cupin domain-containing protein [Roseomonas sp. SXEYE001]MCV4210155.1 pirin family protein [Roseomonas sp. SXEYE001]
MRDRQINETSTIPPLGPGFGGDRHKAALVIKPGDLPSTDPFFLMADDHITTAGPFGEAHPHAGLETVTFMLNGFMADGAGRVEEGDVEWMTAGSGIVHNKDTVVSAGMRLFQLWLILPERERNMNPRVQILKCDEMPVRREPGVEARVYSGRSGDAEATTKNAVPVTLVDIRLKPGTVFEQELPASYNGFMVGLEGEAQVGDRSSVISAGSVGWTYPVAEEGESRLRLTAGPSGARVLLYAGQPQRIRVVARGPFIAGSAQELEGYYRSYRHGEFPHAEALPA